MDDYIEKTSPSGVVIRVNTRKRSFLVIKEGQPQVNPLAEKEKSIVHPLANVIFLGSDFELVDVRPEDIGFFKVESGFMHVPFRAISASDIRHLAVETRVDSDLLPARIYFFSNYRVGMLPKKIEGPVFFFLESRVDRESLIRVKTLYPQSRVGVYKHERITKVELNIDTEGLNNPDNLRAVDLVKQGNVVGEISKNPTFLARIYLRKLEWANMRDLPYKMIVTHEDAQNIKAFLEVMIKNDNGVEELETNKAQIKTLDEFYALLSVLLSFSQVKVDAFFEESTIPQSYLAPVQKVLEAQKSLLGPQAQADFFSYLEQKFTTLNSDN